MAILPNAFVTLRQSQQPSHAPSTFAITSKPALPAFSLEQSGSHSLSFGLGLGVLALAGRRHLSSAKAGRRKGSNCVVMQATSTSTSTAETTTKKEGKELAKKSEVPADLDWSQVSSQWEEELPEAIPASDSDEEVVFVKPNVGVHIADVAHFLKLGTITDQEAQRRSTSVYLIGRVLPMLPHGLCNHLCSLNPNEPKLSFSAFFRLCKRTGQLIQDPAPWFAKTAICSVCRLNYDQAQDVIDDIEIEEENRPSVHGGYTWQQIKDDIKLLYDVCGKVRMGRLNGGALTISKTKMIFHTMNSEDGIPTGYHLESHSASHWVIEELMLLANRCVATRLAHSELSDFSVLRNHKPPEVKKSQQLQKLMRENLGIRDFDMSNATAIYRSCQKIYETHGKMLGLCVEMMIMRAGMQQAEYFVYGADEGEDEVCPHHFALNFDYYTHFTSPIRRYPDVMVHRVLCALLDRQLEAKEGEEGEETRYFQTREEAQEEVQICNTKRLNSRRLMVTDANGVYRRVAQMKPTRVNSVVVQKLMTIFIEESKTIRFFRKVMKNMLIVALNAVKDTMPQYMEKCKILPSRNCHMLRLWLSYREQVYPKMIGYAAPAKKKTTSVQTSMVKMAYENLPERLRFSRYALTAIELGALARVKPGQLPGNLARIPPGFSDNAQVWGVIIFTSRADSTPVMFESTQRSYDCQLE
eukprot:g18323.t2